MYLSVGYGYILGYFTRVHLSTYSTLPNIPLKSTITFG